MIDGLLSEVIEGCSIVTIQSLHIPFNDNERDIAFNSWWQTMLGRSVIDVDVGPGALFEDGFFVGQFGVGFIHVIARTSKWGIS